MSTPAKRTAPPAPPLKGSFPLDHYGDCKALADEYEACLKRNSNLSGRCRELAKMYLECRMENQLMTKQDIAELGFVKERNNDLDVKIVPVEHKKKIIAGLRNTAKRPTGSSGPASDSSSSSESERKKE